MSKIILHPEKGVNPRLSYCRRCGEECQELFLIGTSSHVFTCDDCGIQHLGRRATIFKQTCNVKVDGHRCNGHLTHVRELGDNEKLPATEPCDSCKEELAEHAKIVADGGVYWRCGDCKAEGVVLAEAPFASYLREQYKKPTPESFGVEFSKENCPRCGPQKVKAVGEDNGKD